MKLICLLIPRELRKCSLPLIGPGGLTLGYDISLCANQIILDFLIPEKKVIEQNLTVWKEYKPLKRVEALTPILHHPERFVCVY